MLIHDGLLRFDPEALISVLEDEAKTDGQVRDVVLFRFCREAMLLQSLPMEIDAKSVVAIAAVTEESPAKVPWVDLRSDAATVARSEVIKAYNARFHSTARGLLFRLQKTRWIESWALNCWSGPTAKPPSTSVCLVCANRCASSASSTPSTGSAPPCRSQKGSGTFWRRRSGRLGSEGQKVPDPFWTASSLLAPP